jgi:pimeloyl-ACP methyl ester carboxylesterase
VPQAAEDAVKRIPDARLVRLKDLGHAPQVEAPAAFLSSLRDALRANPNPTPGQRETP